jgi:hydrogenase maturation protease
MAPAHARIQAPLVLEPAPVLAPATPSKVVHRIATGLFLASHVHQGDFRCVTRVVETLIVCLGNERVCDDGVAALVGRVLQSLSLPPNVSVKTAQEVSFDLLDRIATVDQLVLVDALASGEKPGTCTVADVTAIPAALASSECAHRPGIFQILDFVHSMACDDTPHRVAIATIEGKQFWRCGTSLSEEVREAVPRLVDLVLLYVGATVEARAAVHDACHRLSLSDENVWWMAGSCDDLVAI